MTDGWNIPCAAVLFDCDGVLVDSKDAGNRAWTRWAEEHDLDPAAVLDGVHGRRSLETVALFLPEAQRAAGVAVIDGLEIDAAAGTPAMPGARELLQAMPANWAVVTSAALPLLRARIDAAGLRLPPVVVTSEDVSAGKPSPEGYLLAARRLGVPIADCVVIEDSLAGIRAGRAAGAGYVLGIGHDAVGAVTGGAAGTGAAGTGAAGTGAAGSGAAGSGAAGAGAAGSGVDRVGADSVVSDLRACTWTGGGLRVDAAYALKRP